MAASDDELLARAIDGEGDALAVLLQRHALPVRGMLAKDIPIRWRSILSIDDIMQETYATAFRAIGRFKSLNADSFRGWLMTLAKRNLGLVVRMLEAQKRGGQRRRIEPSLGNGFSVTSSNLPTVPDHTPSRQVAQREACAALHGAMQLLPESYRRVVQMYDLDGSPIEEVSEELQRSPGAVYMLRARAHRRLREIMGTESEYFTDFA